MQVAQKSTAGAS